MNRSHFSSFVPDRTIVLIGLMAVGKTSVGKRLAARLGVPFVDSDDEVVAASGMSIPEFFNRYGEAEFRKGESRIITRLLGQPLHILSTGGGAFMHPETRANIREKARSVWLDADLDILVERATRHNDRPLLRHGDPRQILADLYAKRAPLYAEADIHIKVEAQPIDETVDHVLQALANYGHTSESYSS